MAPTTMYVLYEHAVGYTLFRLKEFEEIGLIQPQVEQSVSDISKFNTIISLSAFLPFTSGASALENMISISEGDLHNDLRAFLEANVPSSSKKMHVILGVGDAKLGGSILAELGIDCMASGVLLEIMRGIRMHYKGLVKGMTDISLNRAQMGLGHSYSRTKVKFNVHKVDNMVIQSVNLLDQVDKNLNMFSMRIRESYAYHFPELARIVTENNLYMKTVAIIGDKKTLDDAKLQQIEELLKDSSKVEAIKAASKSSMGMDISPVDLAFINKIAKYTTGHSEFRAGQSEYLKNKMNVIAPNLSTLVGEQVGARLISKAGSLTNLSKFAASTVQILGAEKALFRALKTKGNTPKYGLIYHSTFIGKAPAKQKGRISRFLANKCSIASRIDAFMEYPTNIYGEAMKQQVENRLKFYEDGEKPETNANVMSEAYEKVEKISRKLERKKRKLDASMNKSTVEPEVAEKEPKKKKKRADPEEEVKIEPMDVSIVSNDGKEKKKKKKRHSMEPQQVAAPEVIEEVQQEEIKKDKKKKKHSLNVSQIVEAEKPKKKKRSSLPEN